MNNVGQKGGKDEKKESGTILDIANRVNERAKEGKERDKRHYSFAG